MQFFPFLTLCLIIIIKEYSIRAALQTPVIDVLHQIFYFLVLILIDM